MGRGSNCLAERGPSPPAKLQRQGMAENRVLREIFFLGLRAQMLGWQRCLISSQASGPWPLPDLLDSIPQKYLEKKKHTRLKFEFNCNIIDVGLFPRLLYSGQLPEILNVWVQGFSTMGRGSNCLAERGPSPPGKLQRPDTAENRVLRDFFP